MIKLAFIKKQIEKSKCDRKTSPFLRRLVFYVVNGSLRQYYSEDHPIKCLQASVAIEHLLNKLDIKSRLYTGGVCVPQVYKNNSCTVGWNGFWGEDHHVWVLTEFGELIDLSINSLHLHPMSQAREQEPVPAIWWDDAGEWPRIIKYLPDGAVNIQLPIDEMDDLEKFKIVVGKSYNEALQKLDGKKVIYEPILDNSSTLNRLLDSGHAWVCQSCYFDQANVPLPTWVRERENQLRREYFNRK